MFRSLEEAGIRGVLFSKEGVVETKSLARELGIDSDWNAWISLAEMHEGEENMVNMAAKKAPTDLFPLQSPVTVALKPIPAEYLCVMGVFCIPR